MSNLFSFILLSRFLLVIIADSMAPCRQELKNLTTRQHIKYARALRCIFIFYYILHAVQYIFNLKPGRACCFLKYLYDLNTPLGLESVLWKRVGSIFHHQTGNQARL